MVEAGLPTGTITLARPEVSGGKEHETTLPYGPSDTFFLDMDSNEWVSVALEFLLELGHSSSVALCPRLRASSLFKL